MKKLVVALALTVVPYIAVAQSNFAKYENMKDVSSMVMTSKMFKLLTKIDFESSDAETQQYKDLVKNIDNIKVFATESMEVAQEMKMDVNRYLKTSSLDELMRVNSDGKNIQFYATPGKSEEHVSELFMYLQGNEGVGSETVILTITGNIDLSQVSKLANDLSIPGGKELKNIEKRN